MKRLKATTIEPKKVNPITGSRHSFSELLNLWFDKAYENKWEIKHIINHTPREAVTIIYEYEEGI